MTQKDKVIMRLREVGYVDNFWAFNTRTTLRLASIVDILRKNGWILEGKYGEGRESKNFYYYLRGEGTTDTRKKATSEKAFCCIEFWRGGVHNPKCFILKNKEL